MMSRDGVLDDVVRVVVVRLQRRAPHAANGACLIICSFGIIETVVDLGFASESTRVQTTSLYGIYRSVLHFNVLDFLRSQSGHLF